MAASVLSLPESIRERIAMVRVLCIGFMIFVHVPDNAISALDGGTASVALYSLLFQGFLVEGVGRASAALLSLVSGLLTAVALSRGLPSALYRRRFRSIIVPMVIWSTATVVLYSLLSLVRPTFLQLDGYAPWEAALFYLNTVFFVTDQPLGPTMHLGFLRDLFVCILLSPLLLAAVRHAAPLLFAALTVLYLLDLESVVILRPLVLFAFAIGLWLVTSGTRLDRADSLWAWWAVLSILSTLLVMASGGDRAAGWAEGAWFAQHGIDVRESLLYPLSRLFGGLAIWSLAAKLVGGGWHGRLARVSPYVFVAFCSHYLVLALLWEGLLKPLIGSTSGLAYAAWFAVAPFVAMFCAALIVESLARLAPPLAALLTGGRAGTRSPPRSASRTGAQKASGRPSVPPPNARSTTEHVSGHITNLGRPPSGRP